MRHAAFRLRRTGAVLLCALLLVAAALPGLSAGSPAARADDEEAAPGLRYALGATTAVLADERAPLRLSVLSENQSEEAAPAETLRVVLDPTPLSQDELRLAAAGEAVPPRGGLLGSAVAAVNRPALDPDQLDERAISIEAGTLPLDQNSAPGGYLLRLVTGAGEPAAQVPVLWRGPGEQAELPLTTIVPLGLPGDSGSLPRLATVTELMGPGGRLDELLTQAIALNATLAIDPRVIAAVRVWGDAAPAEATAWLARLEAANLASFSLAFADADLAAQAQLGFSSPLTPGNLNFATRNGSFPPAPEPTETPQNPEDPAEPAPESTPGGASDTEQEPSGGAADLSDSDETPSDPQRPSTASLTEWPTTLAGVAWPAENAVTPGTLSFLSANGYSTVILGSANASATGSGTGNSGTVGGLAGVRLDGAIAAAADRAAAGETATDRAQGTSALIALLASQASEAPPTGLTLGLNRAGAANGDDAAALLAELSALPWLHAQPLETAPAGELSLIDTPIPEERLASLRAAVDAELSVRQIAQVLEEPEAMIGLQRARLLAFFGTDLTAADPEAPATLARVARYEERDEETLRGVQITSTAETQLVGTSSRVPVQLRNHLPFPAAVTASARAVNTSLTVTEPVSPEISIGAESSANVLIPVAARVSSGDSALQVTLHDRAGGQVHEAVLPMSIHSSWETVALVSLGTLAAAFMGFGVWRSLRARRRGQASSDGE